MVHFNEIIYLYKRGMLLFSMHGIYIEVHIFLCYYFKGIYLHINFVLQCV